MASIQKIEEVIGKIEKTVETHMSVIYMGSNGLVAKEIKAVDLGFVSLVPLEKRRDTAIKTAAIDAAYCADLNSKAVEIDGIPMIIMRKFDPSKGLDNLYEQNMVTIEMAEQIGKLYAEAHKKAATNQEISEVGHRRISENWEELFFVTKEVAKAVGKTIAVEDYERITERIREFILKNKEYMEMRKNDGFIRQTHGDGHAGNMFVENGEVKIFDGIGFKDEFSYADVVSDVAFPVMDAIVKGREDIAKEIETSYVDESQDSEGVQKLLGFYICYRAYVRGQVSTMIAGGMEGEAQKGMLGVAKKYYDLAVRYLPN